ncbi:MAG: hypothetical protein Q9187_007549 [Circinaria calcarea]
MTITTTQTTTPNSPNITIESSLSTLPTTIKIPSTPFESSIPTGLGTGAKIGIGLGIPAIVLTVLGVFFVWRHIGRQKEVGSKQHSIAAQAGTSTMQDPQPFLQQKAEMDAEQRRYEMEANETRYELQGGSSIHEVQVVERAHEMQKGKPRQELKGAEHSQELEVPE